MQCNIQSDAITLTTLKYIATVIYIYLYFTNLMVASKYTKKYINKYNTTKKERKEEKNKILR